MRHDSLIWQRKSIHNLMPEVSQAQAEDASPWLSPPKIKG